MIFSCMLWPVKTEHDLSFVSVRQNFKTSLILKILRHLHTEVNIFFFYFLVSGIIDVLVICYRIHFESSEYDFSFFEI